MAEEPSLSYYLPIAGGRIIGFIPFPRVLVLCEMQSVSSRIWTRIAVFISYGDNDYTTGTSIVGMGLQLGLYTLKPAWHYCIIYSTQVQVRLLPSLNLFHILLVHWTICAHFICSDMLVYFCYYSLYVYSVCIKCSYMFSTCTTKAKMNLSCLCFCLFSVIISLGMLILILKLGKWGTN